MKPSKYPRPTDRAGVLSKHRSLKMAQSAQTYVRGSTVKFYEWLAGRKRGTLPQGPPVWICGDCHSGNLGPIADAKGDVEIQIRDFDQTVVGNPAHDLIRLGLSLAIAARDSDLPGITMARILEQMVEGYEHALIEKHDRSNERPDAVRIVMRRAVRRSWKHLAKERLQDIKPTIPLGKTFWPLSRVERAGVDALFKTENARQLATMLRSRESAAAVEVLDAAYWMKGCSSLGLLRLAVLLKVDQGKKSDLCLMDVKEAIRAAAPRYPHHSMPRNNAVRVVTGAKHLSPFLGNRTLAAELCDRSVFIRELLPQDLKLEIDRLNQEEAMKVARFLAGVVGKAHARQMDHAVRARWQHDLLRNRSKSLDAPSWLWSSVVDLIAIHEAAYLEHCRRYVAATA
jgi:uncharacterized protein (DUF2252 family)